jgi:hypothetical protein
LFHAKKFETLTSVEQERNAFVQVMYGFQKLPFLDNGDENESEIWKAARAKREEIDQGKSVDPKGMEVGQKEDEQLRQREERNTEAQIPPIFYGSRKENKEAFWESHKQNVECAQALERALGEHFRNNRLDMEAVLDDMKEYGPERVSIVLANTMTLREGDGRFSSQNREWGQNVVLPESVQEYRHHLVIASHSVLVDAAIKQVRELEREKHDEGIEIGQRVTFNPHDGKTKLTGTVQEINESEVILQCGRATIPALREKGTFTKAPETDRTTTKEYAKEQAQKHAGENGNVYTARGKDVYYEGTIVELTPSYAIQKVEGNAILHRIKDLGKDQSLISVGQDVFIAKDAKGTVTVEPWENRHKEQGYERQQSNGQFR